MDWAFYNAAKLFPKQAKRDVNMLLNFCGSDMHADYWLGRSFVISASVFLITFAILVSISMENVIVAFFFFLIAGMYHIAAYLTLYFKAENRGKAVEKVLPSFLQLIAANINSGMTPFQAFRESSRPEFGILKEEIDRTIALSLSTMQFPEALLDMTGRVKSTTFKDSIELILEGMRTGGSLATLLSDMANDISENMDLKREIVARSKSYILFIAFIVVIGTPLLSVVSMHFIKTIGDITNQVMADMPDIQSVGGITFGQLNLTPEFLAVISLVNITVTSLIASWLLAVINEGKNRYAVKYALLLVPASLGMYYAFDYIIGLFI